MEGTRREPAPERGPIFIVSPMGTGSTLLRLILDSHKDIAIPHETGFMRVYTAMRFIPFKLSGRHWAKRLGWSDDELDEEARRFFDRIFRRYADQHGKRRWGEKTPQHTWHVGKMKRVFPDSVIVAIVRHPGATVASNMRRFGHSARWGVLHCRRYYKEIARLASITHRRMVILRYEDLVLRPEPVLRELIEWLGEDWDPTVLDHHVVQGEREHDRVEGLSRADEPIRSDRIAKWTEELTEGDRTLVSRRLARIAEFYGYSFDDPAAVAPLSPSGSLLFGGEEVGERFASFPDLELTTREEVPLPERFLHPRQVLIIPYPYDRPRFIPGMPDVTAPEQVGLLRRTLGEGVNKLPPAMQVRVRRWGRKAGLRRTRFKQPAPAPGATQTEEY